MLKLEAKMRVHVWQWTHCLFEFGLKLHEQWEYLNTAPKFTLGVNR